MANQATIDALKTELAEKEKEVTALRSAISVLEGGILVGGSVTGTQEYADIGIVAAAKRWLRETGKPQTTSEIKDALIRRGWTTTSKLSIGMGSSQSMEPLPDEPFRPFRLVRP